jgi:hypothetical protein
MPRPKLFKTPSRLSLTLDKHTKDKARKYANRNGISIARLFAQYINNLDLTKTPPIHP